MDENSTDTPSETEIDEALAGVVSATEQPPPEALCFCGKPAHHKGRHIGNRKPGNVSPGPAAEAASPVAHETTTTEPVQILSEDEILSLTPEEVEARAWDALITEMKIGLGNIAVVESENGWHCKARIEAVGRAEILCRHIPGMPSWESFADCWSQPIAALFSYRLAEDSSFRTLFLGLCEFDEEDGEIVWNDQNGKKITVTFEDCC